MKPEPAGLGGLRRRQGPLALGQDAEKLSRLGRTFQVEVMFADDRFGVAGLERRLAEGTELRYKHGNERVPHEIVGKVELLDGRLAQVLEIGRDDGESLQRVSPQPGPEVRLDRDHARFADF